MIPVANSQPAARAALPGQRLATQAAANSARRVVHLVTSRGFEDRQGFLGEPIPEGMCAERSGSDGQEGAQRAQQGEATLHGAESLS